MVELSPALAVKIEKMHRLSEQKENLYRKLRKNSDEYRAIVYRRLILKAEDSISLITQGL